MARQPIDSYVGSPESKCSDPKEESPYVFAAVPSGQRQQSSRSRRRRHALEDCEKLLSRDMMSKVEGKTLMVQSKARRMRVRA